VNTERFIEADAHVGNLRVTGFSYLSFSKRRAKHRNPVNRGFAGNRQSGNARKAATGFRCLPLFCRFVLLTLPVGAAEGCDL
jgi:hypothetical protein